MNDGFLRRRLIQPVINLLTQGVTPKKIAMSLALGLVIGVFPVLGSTTLLCAIAAVALRLNLPALQLANWIVYPLQLVFIVPFIRLGEFIFRARPLPFTLEQMVAISRAGLPHAIRILWLAALQGASAWLLVSPLLVCVFYLVFLVIVRNIAQLTGPRPEPAEGV